MADEQGQPWIKGERWKCVVCGNDSNWVWRGVKDRIEFLCLCGNSWQRRLESVDRTNASGSTPPRETT